MGNLGIVIAMVFAVAMGCENEKSIALANGTYTGTFEVKYGSETLSGPVTLVLDNGTYSCTGNPDRIPAGGSGTFELDEESVRFVDNNFWTADFDWNLILKGTYTYAFDGKRLRLSSEIPDMGEYVYTLRKN